MSFINASRIELSPSLVTLYLWERQSVEAAMAQCSVQRVNGKLHDAHYR